MSQTHISLARAGAFADELTSIVDSAHAHLGPRDLTDVLLCTRRVAAGIARGEAVALPRTPAPPQIRSYMDDLERAAARVARADGGAGSSAAQALAEELDALVDEIAARPRGAAAA